MSEIVSTDEVNFVMDGENIDEYGHVNYAAIPKFFESFQDQLLMTYGNTSFPDIEKKFGLRSFVKKLEITWDGEVKQGDNCRMETELTLGNTSMKFTQRLFVRGKLAISLFLVVVIVNNEGIPTPIPHDLKISLS